MDPRDRILELARGEGFDLVRFASAEPLLAARAVAQDARGEGNLEGLSWMTGEWIDRATDPGRFLEGARTVVLLALAYHHRDPERPGDQARGRVARYARGRDYHRVFEKKLRRIARAIREELGAAARPTVDYGPLLERPLAAASGMGWLGKSTMLLVPGAGPWVLLGAVATSLDIAPDGSLAKSCGACTRCIVACPTGAIAPDGHLVDARRCISYHTIVNRGAIPRDLRPLFGDWVFGCDACQEACPHAQPTRRSRRAGVHEAYAPHRSAFPLLELLGWNQQRWEAARLNGVLARVGPAGWRRNAALACIGALADPGLDAGLREALLARLHALAASMDEPPAVRQAAQQAIDSTRAAR